MRRVPTTPASFGRFLLRKKGTGASFDHCRRQHELVLNGGQGALRRGAAEGDRPEILSTEAGPADQRAIDIGERENRLGIPRADTLPRVTVDFSPVPSPTNPLGAKGVGEGGTVAATPTVMNAILDARAPLGVTDVPMPATPERIWHALRQRAT